MARYDIVPERSTVEIDARSSLHAIHTRVEGVEGFVDLVVGVHGAIDVDAESSGRLSVPVARLKAGNPLEDRELRRRVDARRYPTIQGDLVELRRGTDGAKYRVVGDLTFLGVTNRYEYDMTITSLEDGAVRLAGEATFDVRAFGLEPPRILVVKVEPLVTVRVDVVAAPKAKERVAGVG